MLSIDYQTKYEYALWVSPYVPFLLYLRDPRAEEEWTKLSTVKDTIITNLRSNAKQMIKIVDHR